MSIVMANHDPVLKAHLENPRLRNATYISPHTQNEIFDIIGKRIIQNSIIKEVIQAHYKEIMPLCVQFVDVHKDIREEFIQFSTLE